MNNELITKLANIATVIGCVVALVYFVGWLYNIFVSPKLRYAVKKYRLSKNKYFYVLCVWNPLYKNITKSNVTKDIKILTFGKGEELSLLQYTDQSLKHAVTINDSKICFEFDEFPRRSGIIITFVADSFIRIEGELCNKENIIDCSHLDTINSFYLNVMIWWCLEIILFPKLHIGLAFLASFIPASLRLFSLPCFTNPMPKILRKYFNGEQE